VYICMELRIHWFLTGNFFCWFISTRSSLLRKMLSNSAYGINWDQEPIWLKWDCLNQNFSWETETKFSYFITVQLHVSYLINNMTWNFGGWSFSASVRFQTYLCSLLHNCNMIVIYLANQHAQLWSFMLIFASVSECRSHASP
jgi:hypothetical protein